MPYPNWHAARVKSPSAFEKDSFRTKAIDNGITTIMGRLRGSDTMTIQTYRFDKDDFTAAEAKKWLADHDVKYISFEAATGEPRKVQALVSLITGEVQALSLSQAEILALVPPDKLKEIKSRDPHPFFKAYSIVHEGLSRPKFLDTETKPIRWFKKAVQSIKDVVLRGVKFFLGHGVDTNDHVDREAVGEIVGDAQRTIDGKLHHIAVGYFPDRSKVEAMDICSQEAEWTFFDYAKEYVASKIEKITGIALSDSRYDEPAFPDARCVGMIQAFDRSPDQSRKEENMGAELDKVALDDIVKELKRRQTRPTEIFAVEEIMKVKEVQEVAAKVGELETTVNEKNEKIETLESEKTGLIKKTEASTAEGRLKKILEENKATEQQVEYVLPRFKKRAEKLEDLSDDALKKFAEDVLEDFTDNAQFFGGSGGEQTTPPAKGNKGASDGESADYTKPENNELLAKPTEE